MLPTHMRPTRAVPAVFYMECAYMKMHASVFRRAPPCGLVPIIGAPVRFCALDGSAAAKAYDLREFVCVCVEGGNAPMLALTTGIWSASSCSNTEKNPSDLPYATRLYLFVSVANTPISEVFCRPYHHHAAADIAAATRNERSETTRTRVEMSSAKRRWRVHVNSGILNSTVNTRHTRPWRPPPRSCPPTPAPAAAAPPFVAVLRQARIQALSPCRRRQTGEEARASHLILASRRHPSPHLVQLFQHGARSLSLSLSASVSLPPSLSLRSAPSRRFGKILFLFAVSKIKRLKRSRKCEMSERARNTIAACESHEDQDTSAPV